MSTLEDLLHRLRSAGWMVAAHNDYRLSGVAHTFWLFTHVDGRYLKGEGRTDVEALTFILEQTDPDGATLLLGSYVSARCEPCNLRAVRQVRVGELKPCLKCGGSMTTISGEDQP